MRGAHPRLHVRRVDHPASPRGVQDHPQAPGQTLAAQFPRFPLALDLEEEPKLPAPRHSRHRGRWPPLAAPRCPEASPRSSPSSPPKNPSQAAPYARDRASFSAMAAASRRRSTPPHHPGRHKHVPDLPLGELRRFPMFPAQSTAVAAVAKRPISLHGRAHRDFAAPAPLWPRAPAAPCALWVPLSRRGRASPSAEIGRASCRERV